ncbi:unnamed protein product, partial [marine sediment metagenome]
KHDVHQVIVEKNFGMGMFGQLFRPILAQKFRLKYKLEKDTRPDMPEGCGIEEVHHSGQKELRILDAMEGVVQTHRLMVSRDVIENDLEVQEIKPQYSFIYQFTRMTRERGALAHEDRLEAVSMACKYWVDLLDRDTSQALAEHKQDLLDEELEKYLENAISPGKPYVPRELNWISQRN